MASKTVIHVTCDLTHPVPTEGVQTITILDPATGEPREIDACGSHVHEFTMLLAPWVKDSRPAAVAPGPPRRSTTAGNPPRTRNRDHSGQVRLWAAKRLRETEDEKYAIATRGRISRAIEDEYLSARSLSGAL